MAPRINQRKLEMPVRASADIGAWIYIQ